MQRESVTKDTGLRGVTIANTRISLIDAVQGELSYRGYDIHDLANYSTYEEVAYLLLYGELPLPSQMDEFTSTLRSERVSLKRRLSFSKKYRSRLGLWMFFSR